MDTHNIRSYEGKENYEEDEMKSNQFEEDDIWEKLQLKLEVERKIQERISANIKKSIELHEQKYHSKED